ncbi:MAG TPA: HEAT repeat domain-containing protein, partial [Thermoanaerobaculia bacterium]|nr:HEAT repeat domain-containing protein [Thermoanaerobaculia bacterium]
AEVVAAEVDRRKVDARDVERLIDQGVVAWRARGPLLTRRVFALVHRHRRSLRLQQEEIALLVRCSLLYDDKADLGATRYWLRRLGSPSLATDLLLSALFHRTAAVRRRAAQLLGDLPQPAVRDQLHTLALRDPDADVRQSANTSLAAMQSEELRGRLQAEIRAEASPYRETALAALAIFRDAATVAFLRELLGSPRLDSALRQAALRALGELASAEAVDLLLEIGLAGNGEDSERAACSLAAIHSEPLQAKVLRALREPRGSARPASLVPGFEVAVLFALANNVVHGSFLLFKKRYRLGLAILGLEILVVAASAALGPAAGVLLFATWTASQLSALRIALGERRLGRPAPDSLPGPIAALLVLTTFCNPFFWIFHGLVHAAARRLRRAAVLLGLELVGALLVATFFSLEVPEIGGSSRWDSILAIALYAYLWLGVALFFGSFLYDVGAVFIADVLLADTLALRKRRQRIYARLLRNPVVAGQVIAALRSTERSEKAWARNLVRTHGEEMDPNALLARLPEQPPALAPLLLDAVARGKTETTVGALVATWETADAPARDATVRILARHPSEASTESLAGLWRSLSWRQRWQAGLGQWQFRFQVWPRTALLALLLTVPLVAVLGIDGVLANRHPAQRQLRTLEKEGNGAALRIAAASFLAKAYPSASEALLASLLQAKGTQLEVKEGLAASLGEIVRAAKSGGERLGRTDEKTRRAALEALIETGRHGSDLEVRRAALKSLASLAGESEGSPLSDLLR